MDPFIIAETPDIYVIGYQPRFVTRLVKDGKHRSRVVLVPSFAQTGILVLVGLKSLDVRIVRLTEDVLVLHPCALCPLLFSDEKRMFYYHFHLHV